MPVTDASRLRLIQELRNATPETRALLKIELEHQRKMDRLFLRTEHCTLGAAGLVIVAVFAFAIWCVTQGAEAAAALAVIADVYGASTILIRRSYFISNSAPTPATSTASE